MGLTMSSLPKGVLQDIQTKEQLGKNNGKCSNNTRRNRSCYAGERQPSPQNSDQIVVHDGRNQSGGKYMINEEASISVTCCLIKETSGVDTCRNCHLWACH